MSLDPRRATSTDYARPYRPRAVAAVNRLGRAWQRLGGGQQPLTSAALMRAAERTTGLDDFGDDSFREPLDRLCAAIENEARLSAVGRLITRARLVSTLANRLRAEALLRHHPEILEQPVRAPIVIAGLQRTGTTLLHRLLATDPGIRALASWESIGPAPAPRRIWQRRDPRIGRAKMAERALRYLAPDFFAIHPVEAEAPEEDVILLDYSFLSTVPEAMLRVPSYATWLEEQDQAPAYRYLKRLLQLLQWQRPGDRWVLKSPHHLEWLDTLLAEFPDARIVQTHRDPARTIPSTCSMIAHSRGVFSDEVDPHEVGRQWSRKIFRLIERSMSTRERTPAGTFFDVSYADFVADPLAQMRALYGFVDRPLAAEISAQMAAALERNVRHKYGRHRYRLADFGLDADEVGRRVAPYCARFDIRSEKQ